MKKILIYIIVAMSFLLNMQAEYLQVKCKSGDGITILLNKYKLPITDLYISTFKELNAKKINKKGELLLGYSYKMPIKIAKYNGKNIRSSLNISSFEEAKSIQEYNELLHKLKLIPQPYTKSKKLYVPIEYSYTTSHSEIASSKGKAKKDKYTFDYSLFGSQRKIKEKDNKLAGIVYYISSGHGGIDPGAIGYKKGKALCEDEYAYDVSIRTAKALLEHGAKVYMILEDPNDGIRDAQFLEPDSDEHLYGNEPISHNQTTRLTRRTEIMNRLYKENMDAKSQIALIIHVDSRYEDKRIDIFFYHKDGDVEGKAIANTLYKTIKEKYEAHQPGRGYYGSISARDLLEIRKTIPHPVYIELGNIQNPSDQIRFINPDNRQALANWIVDGLIKHAQK